EASRDFNTIRGIDSAVVEESLAPFDASFLSKLTLPQRVEARADVKAAEQEMRQARARSRTGAEKSKPELNLVGSVGLNGRDPRSGPTFSEASTNDYPYTSIGVRLDVPLNLSATGRIRDGYRKEQLAAELRY
ncbi:TolC family protein, partial [Escherichia coli]|nr:TolC family protein [Escherichia coli]